MAESDSGDACERYEFDAPSEVVDLKELENAEYDDKWFGPSTSAAPNIVTSWGATAPAQNGARPKRRTAAQSPAQPCRVSKRKGLTSGPAAPPSKKHKKSPVGRPAPKRSSVIRRNALQNSRTEAKTRASSSAAASTTAHTEPSTSEEQELERIRNLQKEVALHRKKNEASYKAALAGNVPPKKMVLSATVPKEFHFNTNNRVKTAASSSTAHKEVDFIGQLRKPSSPAKALKGATVPKPFNLINKQQEKDGGASCLCPSPVKGDRLKLTQAHTPHLMTNHRSRPPTVKSSAELEAEEVDRLHKFKFKAQELNRKILENVEGLKKPAVKGPTVPEGFELQIEKRLQGRQATKPQEGEEKHAFKSQPLPKKILEGVVVKPPSPIKAPPVPHFGLPFQPRLAENHQVEVCPFSFEERERERRALKEKRLEEMRNEEVPQFKAQPLPDFDTVVLPEKKKLGPTKPEPFRLLLDERGAAKERSLGTHGTTRFVKEEQKHQEEAAKFKARPNTVTHKEPFQPKKECRSAAEGIHSSTVVEAFELSTERRARERQEYERLASEKEALRAMMEEEQRREEEERAKEEITRLRQEQVHKAQPIRHYKPVALKKSEVPLTIPHSPNFSDRFRL
ncbi:Targeting protein for Xklp2-B [Nibea albiflora]|uniref:Targeting protein for Xklp2-B n=1 Tax=Nibea albiflora TaxID=240163 RepID=A0ACB7EL64_NIBAL|nr:Targeting protein for Xklp2-B [Nibea albiflora]